VVEHLPSKHAALSTNPKQNKTKNKWYVVVNV
jgi:hypothetical protein